MKIILILIEVAYRITCALWFATLEINNLHHLLQQQSASATGALYTFWGETAEQLFSLFSPFSLSRSLYDDTVTQWLSQSANGLVSTAAFIMSQTRKEKEGGCEARRPIGLKQIWSFATVFQATIKFQYGSLTSRYQGN